MPRKNIYFSDSDLEYYELAKKYAGDSLSLTIVQGLKDFVWKKQMEEKSMEEVTKFIGENVAIAGFSTGQNIKFIGKKISSGVVEAGVQRYLQYELYYTRKGQFLLYEVDNEADFKYTTSYKLYRDYNELNNKTLPSGMLKEAADNLKQFNFEACEVLDI